MTDGCGPAGAAEGEAAHQTHSARAARVALVVAIVVLTGTALPYVMNRATCPPGQVATGLLTWLPDHCSYIAWIRQVLEGGPIYDLYTPEPHEPVAAPAFWSLLGYAARLLHLTPIAAYHLARLSLAALYLLVLWWALGVWVPTPGPRLVAFTAVAGGSGVGLLTVPFGAEQLAADLQMPELWSFASCLYWPHFAASLLLTAAILWALGVLWLRPHRPACLPALAIGLGSVVLVLVHPYTWFALAAATLLYTALYSAGDLRHEGRSLPAARRWAGPGLVMLGLPLVAHQALAFRAHPILRQWLVQNALPSPSPLSYVVGFGLVLLAAALVLIRPTGSRRTPPERNFAFSWVIAAFLLAYSYPLVPFARRCVEGAHVLLVLLALPVLTAVARLGARRLTGDDLLAPTGATGRALAAGALVTALLLWPTAVYEAVRASGDQAGRVSLAVRDGWRAIEAEVPPATPILCLATDGPFLPAMTGRRVWAGHFHLTTYFRARRDLADRFFHPATDNRWRARMLAASGCGYVFCGALDPQVRRALDELLGEPVWQQGSAALYKVPR